MVQSFQQAAKESIVLIRSPLGQTEKHPALGHQVPYPGKTRIADSFRDIEPCIQGLPWDHVA
jgi:hypothetical protein